MDEINVLLLAVSYESTNLLTVHLLTRMTVNRSRLAQMRLTKPICCWDLTKQQQNATYKRDEV